MRTMPAAQGGEHDLRNNFEEGRGMKYVTGTPLIAIVLSAFNTRRFEHLHAANDPSER